MINTRCPICKQEADPSGKGFLFPFQDEYGNAFEIMRCVNCKNIFSWFSRDIDVTRYYDDLDYSLQDTRNTIFYTIQKIEYNRVLRVLKKLAHSSNKTLLDFGCGKGVFLSFAKHAFDVKGIETSPPRADFAEKYFQLEISTDYYESGQVFPQKFDMLTIFHVIEHLPDPVTLIHNLLAGNLSKDGILVIETPNFESWQSTWAGNRWMQLDVPRHLSHFEPAVVRKLVESAGCSIVHYQTFSFHLGIMGMAQTLMSKFGYQGFLMSDLKHKRTWKLMLFLVAVLPFATALEFLAACNKRGGIIRYYARKERQA